ncbi:MOSC domain-containing protein [Nocardioides jensenii]|uniref:MOSC domain-containing protein n=1 Tax=Nocardioides jensenii TaxID=1843 RepID=UPI000830D013|nr:MOSC domain-containing protein [Nocardioides jensenii]
MHASVLHVSVGLPRDQEWAGSLKRTAIVKHTVEGPVAVRRRGLDGDQVADTRNHGGPDMAVYAFAREDVDRWQEQLGAPIRNGQFGENLTTEGIDVNEALVGERWRIGSVLLEVTKVRIPCSVFKNWMRLNGYDDTAWVKRFAADGRPGPYLRVLEEGEIRAGDPITVEHRPDHGITVSQMFRALTTERDLAPSLLAIDGLAESVREMVARSVVGSAADR